MASLYEDLLNAMRSALADNIRQTLDITPALGLVMRDRIAEMTREILSANFDKQIVETLSAALTALSSLSSAHDTDEKVELPEELYLRLRLRAHT